MREERPGKRRKRRWRKCQPGRKQSEEDSEVVDGVLSTHAGVGPAAKSEEVALELDVLLPLPAEAVRIKYGGVREPLHIASVISPARVPGPIARAMVRLEVTITRYNAGISNSVTRISITRREEEEEDRERVCT